MRITILVTVRDDLYATHEQKIEVDQEPFSLLGRAEDDDRPDRSIDSVRHEAIRTTKAALDRLIRQAVES